MQIDGCKNTLLQEPKVMDMKLPRALPDEEVTFRIGYTRRNKCRTREPEVKLNRYDDTTPGPYSKQDKHVCPHFKEEECSGCQFNNLKYGRQLLEKRRLLNEVWRDRFMDLNITREQAMTKLGVGKIQPTLQQNTKQFVEFHFGRDHKMKPELGFYMAKVLDEDVELYHNAPEVIAVTSCSLIDSVVLRVYTAVRRAFKLCGQLPRGTASAQRVQLVL